MIGIGIRGLALTRIAKAIEALFSPASLFSAGEVGAWYDPSDLTTMFQDAAGAIAAVVDGPVGRINDKSGRGNHARQTTATKRPILKLIEGKYSLLFDGIDDALVTGSIDFTATDKMTVVAGVRKLSDAALSALIEISADLSANAGFSFLAPATVGATYRFASKGTVGLSSAITSATYSAPITNVLTGIASISTDVAVLRINGTQAATSAADQGTGNYGNYPLYIGSRAGTSLPFNGHIYSLIVRGAQSTDAQIVAAETWVNGKTGAY